MPEIEPLQARNRVIERRRMRGADLAPNPRNWRLHPDDQKAALRGVLREIGQVGELYAYYSARNGGRLTLIDGHLRSSDDFAHLEWDVAVTDLDDAEADKLLLAYDPIAALAEASFEHLDGLLRSVAAEDAELATFYEQVGQDYGLVATASAADSAGFTAVDPIVDRFQHSSSTSVLCPSCGHSWALSTTEIGRIKQTAATRKEGKTGGPPAGTAPVEGGDDEA